MSPPAPGGGHAASPASHERPGPAAGQPAAAKKKSPVYRIGGVALGVAVVTGLFVGVIPQFASYRDAWTAIARMSPGWWAAIAAAAALGLAFGVWPFQAALPRLRFWPGFMQVQTSTAVSTTVPAGGPLALGLTYRMFSSFGFPAVAITSAVVTTGLWSLGFKFALPILAVALMAATGHSTGGAVGISLAGVAALALCGTVAWLVFRDEDSARRLGRRGDRIANWVLRFFHRSEPDRVQRALVSFRDQSAGVIRQRGQLVTAAVLADQLGVFFLVLFCVRAAGIPAGRVGFLPVLLSFAVARLAGALPVTPGGLGGVDASFTGMLVAFGATSSHALAADLVWRATTYFPPIVLGIVSYVLWRHGVDKGIYRDRPAADGGQDGRALTPGGKDAGHQSDRQRQ
jgi:putative heme transporter